MKQKWECIVEGELKNRLEDKIREISGLLQDQSQLPGYPGLLAGKVGIAIFFFYAAHWANNDTLAERGIELIEEIFDQINAGYDDYRLSTGLAGIGWAVESLNRSGYIQVDSSDILNGIDGFLGRTMIQEMVNGRFDYLHHATGNCLYLLYRLDRQGVAADLGKYLEAFEGAALREDDGSLKWESVIIKEKGTRGINLGLAHGMPGLYSMLGKMMEKGIEPEKTLKLIEGTVKFLLKQRLDRNRSLSNFPYSIANGEAPIASRLAWCFGDLGIGISLWLTGRRINRPEWQSLALDIMLDSTRRRDLKENRLVDAGLCHGTAGVAHIYNRMYQYSGLPEFRNAANYWFNQTLSMATHHDGLAGYKAFRTDNLGGYAPEVGFLEGIAGIALAMIAATSPIEPMWDECLLLS